MKQNGTIPPATAAVSGRAGQVHSGLVQVLSHPPSDRSAAPTLVLMTQPFFFFFYCATQLVDRSSVIQMTIISTTVGNNPLEEVE